MRVRVPASSANLGPGYDTLGLALNLYTEVTVEPSDRLELSCVGEGSTVPMGASHLAVRVARDVLGHDRVRIDIRSDIPLSRGLGSSAALVVAVAAACGADDPLRYGATIEGHADNVAACVLGGFVTATMSEATMSEPAIGEGAVSASRLPLDTVLRFVAIIPERGLKTSTARSVVPTQIPHADAVFNLGRMGQLIAGMADHRLLTPQAGEDRLHQHYRTALYPESVGLLRALTDAGALASFWSGAGPTLLGVCHASKADSVQEAAMHSLTSVSLLGEVRVLDADLNGLTYL